MKIKLKNRNPKGYTALVCLKYHKAIPIEDTNIIGNALFTIKKISEMALVFLPKDIGINIDFGLDTYITEEQEESFPMYIDTVKEGSCEKNNP